MQPSQFNPNKNTDKYNPALRKRIERNIRTIIHLRRNAAHKTESPTPSSPLRGGRSSFIYKMHGWRHAEIHRLQAFESSRG